MVAPCLHKKRVSITRFKQKEEESHPPALATQAQEAARRVHGVDAGPRGEQERLHFLQQSAAQFACGGREGARRETRRKSKESDRRKGRDRRCDVEHGKMHE